MIPFPQVVLGQPLSRDVVPHAGPTHPDALIPLQPQALADIDFFRADQISSRPAQAMIETSPLQNLRSEDHVRPRRPFAIIKGPNDLAHLSDRVRSLKTGQ